MEAEAKKIPSAQEYLYAMIRCAEWVSDDYKKLAEKSKGNLEILKELYLCACDGLPIEKAQGALEKKRAPEKVLYALRKKFLEEKFSEGYEEEIHGIRKKAAKLELDVKRMKEEVNDIAERMPTLETAFPEQELQEIKPMESRTEDVRDTTADNMKQEQSQEDVPESGTHDAVKRKRLQRGFVGKKSRRSYIENLLSDGYDNKQLTYLLDCLEGGMTPNEIEKIASPKLPVEVMERLRRMEEKQVYRNPVQDEGRKKGRWEQYFAWLRKKQGSESN